MTSRGVSSLSHVLFQGPLVAELLPARTNVHHSKMLRLDVTFAVHFLFEHLRAIRTDEEGFAVDLSLRGRPVESLEMKKYDTVTSRLTCIWV